MENPKSDRRRKYWFGGQKSDGQDTAFREALDPQIWEKGSEDDWDAYWFTGMPKATVFKKLGPGKTVNHIPGNNGVTVKSLLHDTLAKARRRLAGHSQGNRFDFFPQVYSMPQDYFALQESAAAQPNKLWIQKPKGLSRGRGIQVLEDAAVAPKSDDWLVQEYLDRPHLYDGHKYVLRCYVVVRGVDPLKVYWYKEGFAKLASEKYSTDPTSLKNLFVHLTNPDVNEENDEAPSSVIFISFEKYRQWLRDQGHDDGKIFQDLEDLIVLTFMSARERMRTRMVATDTDQDGCYELFGLDCMLDADLKPWILECNLSPSLDVCSAPEDGGIDEERIKRQLVVDIVSMIGANETKPDWSANSFAEKITAEWDWEKGRLGDFRSVYPGVDPSPYLTAFPVPRASDVVLAKHVLNGDVPEIGLVANEVEEFVLEDALALYSARNKQFYAPNQTASWIWLQMAEGLRPQEIIAQLSEQTHAPLDQVERDVWDTLADWSQKGLVRSADQEPITPEEQASQNENWVGEETFSAGDLTYNVRYTHKPVAQRLAQLAHAGHTDAEGSGDQIDIVRGAQGYTVLKGPRLIASDVRLSRVAPLIDALQLQDQAGQDTHHMLLPAGLAAGDTSNCLVVSDPEGLWHSLAFALAACGNAHWYAGAVRLSTEPGAVVGLPHPLWIEETCADRIDLETIRPLARHLHEIRVGNRVRLAPAVNIDGKLQTQLDAIVLPEFKQGAEATIETMSTAAALPRLASAIIGAVGQPDRLVDWIGDLPVFRVIFSDVVAAAKTVHARTSAGRPHPIDK